MNVLTCRPQYMPVFANEIYSSPKDLVHTKKRLCVLPQPAALEGGLSTFPIKILIGVTTSQQGALWDTVIVATLSAHIISNLYKTLQSVPFTSEDTGTENSKHNQPFPLHQPPPNSRWVQTPLVPVAYKYFILYQKASVYKIIVS